MTKQQAKERAIEIAKGRECKPCATVAHDSNELCMTLLMYDGEEAVCQDVNQGKMRFPRAEIFDPNLVVNIANHLLNLGFWQEGMESKIVTTDDHFHNPGGIDL